MNKKNSNSIVKFLVANSTYVVLVILFIVCVILSPAFLTSKNITNLIRQYSALIIISMGMLTVIKTGGIDLSVGALYALASVLTAGCFVTLNLPFTVVLIICLLVGAIFGLVTGTLVSVAGMAAFVTSLSLQLVARGLAYIISGGMPVSIPSPSIFYSFGLGSFFSGLIPYLGILALVIVLIFWFFEKYTAFGRIVLAIGSNERAVKLSGIKVNKYKINAYVISGVCATLAGIVAVCRSSVGTPIIGIGLETDAIASCVIGGASLAGGEGSAVKTVAGVLVLALIGNIMNLLGIGAYMQDVMKGVIIVVAVLLRIYTSKK